VRTRDVLGTSEFTEALEKITVRRLAAAKGRTPKGKPAADKKQQMLGFDP
jgi:hypothetical protein